jgi:hypothetical protein
MPFQQSQDRNLYMREENSAPSKSCDWKLSDFNSTQWEETRKVIRSSFTSALECELNVTCAQLSRLLNSPTVQPQGGFPIDGNG